MTNAEQRAAAKQFVKDWSGKGYEKGESQPFWLALLRNVYGVEQPERFITFEEQVHLDHTSFIDGFIPATHVLIEQKGLGKNLNKPIKQSDGTLLTPFQQAKRYSAELPYSERPRWIVTCNFKEFYIYDMERPTGEPEIVLLENLGTEYYRLQFLVDTGDENIKKEMEISLQAGEIVGALYDALLKEYKDPDDPETLKNLNALCVRLVFCLYAEDAGIFGSHKMFHNYLQAHEKEARQALINLFKILDTETDNRDPYLEEDLLAFPYVNGGLFADENIVIPRLNETIIDLILHKASENFNWSAISPTIFGAVFESTLNPETRRKGGMHYTSIENIHKVIDPLFLDELKEEIQKIKEIQTIKTREKKLREFQTKLSNLKFLDPACGSGNFLTETYISLRRLENETISLLIDCQKGIAEGQIILGSTNPIKVSISQFYGIEINDFAVTVAKTALWIAESQMMKETEDIVHMSLDFLPLKSYANITEGNALRIDWENVIPKNELHYIMGNPPFVGARIMSASQKNDLLSVFGKIKNVGNMDYVCSWYKKAADFMTNTMIRTALVSTNSVSQGEQVANLWKPLFESGVHIDFAHRTFRWDSEAKIKAHVHCVIIGFSKAANSKNKMLYVDDRVQVVENINGYLLDAENIFIESRNKPIYNVPEISMGNQPIDNGNYLFTQEEKDEFIKKEPKSEKYFKLWYGAEEFINRKPRYCLWLGNCKPNELKKMPECIKRINNVRKYRLSSKRMATLKLADTPTRFQTENMPSETYIVIPEVSSEKRKYIPIGFMNSDVLCSNKLRVIPNANLYHFGVLTSNVHMAWMRAVCGRLEMRYQYSNKIVYNNFPWCNPTPEQKAKIEQTAQAILDARALYPDSSLADLYDELTMPPELRKAHQQNDRAVMQAYGFSVKDMTESKCVAELMKLYQSLV
jgi:type I restriction-modification system DNA methylase subunit